MESIIQAWEEERKSPRVAHIPSDIEQTYQSERNKLRDQLAAASAPLDRRMSEIASQRLDFYFQDLFLLRKEKLLLSTYQGENVQTDFLLPWEQQYYAELRRMEYFYKQNLATQTPVTSSPQALIPLEKKQASSIPPPAEIPLPPPEITGQDFLKDAPLPSAPEGQDAGNYMAVRFLQGEGAIIGVDMREYGPFEAGEIAYLPEVHARIFITNGVAKQIFPSG